MSRKFLITEAVLLFFCGKIVTGSNTNTGASPGWTYEKGSSSCNGTITNPCGPSNWGKVAAAGGCATSMSQSPINFGINAVQNLTLVPPKFKYLGGGCSQWSAFTNAYVLEVAFNNPAENVACKNLSVTYGGVNYGLLQMHFHSPSEHTIGNGRHSAEAHMVHQSASGGYLVIGVFLEVDSPYDYAVVNNDDKNEYDDGVNRNNKFLQNIWTARNSSGGVPVKTFVPGSPNLGIEGTGIMNPYIDLIPGRQSLYHYTGGLTTPPCVVPGGVSWWVFDEPVTVSAKDIYFIRKVVQAKGNFLSNKGDNARPSQPLNGRMVSYVPAVPAAPTFGPTFGPTTKPTAAPTIVPSFGPTFSPTTKPSAAPTIVPTIVTPAPTRISKGGVAAAVLMSIFGFFVIVGLVLYFVCGYTGGEEEEHKSLEFATIPTQGASA